MTFGSVCSGIEAASAAWLPLGWQCSFMSEIESAPRSVLAHHYPETKLYGDFTAIGPDAGPIDVLVGGTPCQSFSVAGLRGGMDDARGNLALEFCRLADRLRPRWVVWENVPGVLSSNGGRDFGSILGAMGELGYGTAYRILDAQYSGVPQRRRRVFVVGYLGDWRRAAAVLFERHSLSGYPPPRREAGQGVTGSLASRTSAGGGLGTDFDCAGGVIPILEAGARTGTSTDDPRAGIGIGESGDPMFTLQSGKQHGVFASTGDGYWQEGAGTLRGRTQESHEHLIASTGQASHCLNAGGMGRIDYETETLVVGALMGGGTPNGHGTAGINDQAVAAGHIVAFSCKDHGADAGEVSPTLRAMEFDGSHANGGGQVAIAVALAIRGRDGTPQIEMGDEVANAILTPNGGRGGIGVGAILSFHENQRHELTVSDTAGSLKSGGGKPGQGYPAALHGSAVRRLTPLECCRLQGFRDDYFTGVLHRGKPLADGSIYKMLGNSMAVPCMAWIGQRIQAVEAAA